MAGTEQEAGGVELAEAEGRFRAWRENRRRGQRIPPELWRMAVGLVGRYSLRQVAERLAVNEARLSRLCEADGVRRPERQVEAAGETAVFVEMGRLGHGPADGCIIEAADGRGGNLTIRLNGGACAQAAELVKALWKERE